MGWTSRSDREPCCGESPGAVGDKEKVARLLHNGISLPEQSRIKRKELWPIEKKKLYSHECGVSDGASVTRCSDLTDADIRRCSKAYADVKGRVSDGAVVALSSDLRSIRHSGVAGQVIFLYDDPKQDDRKHAVIRASESVPATDQDRIRADVLTCFKEKVQP